MRISDLYEPEQDERLAANSLPAMHRQSLGEFVAPMLVAQMPRASAWAIRPGNFEVPYMLPNYDDAMSVMEPFGINPDMGGGAVRLVPKPMDLRQAMGILRPANQR